MGSNDAHAADANATANKQAVVRTDPSLLFDFDDLFIFDHCLSTAFQDIMS